MVVLVGAYLAVLEFSRPHVSGDKLRFDTLVDLVDEGRIRDVTFLDEDAYVVGTYVRDDGSVGRYNAPLIRNFQGDLLALLLHGRDNRIPITIDQQVGKRVAALASVLLPGLILVLLFAYLILSYRRGTGIFSIGSGARRIETGATGVTFADVAGQDAAVADLREIQEFLGDPERFTALGAAVPKGVLLFGPPGSGKTLLARALAGEAGANFYSMSGSDFVELYAGVGAARVRTLFEEARAHAPAIIFIDELDSIGRARAAGGNVLVHAEQEQGLNQILAEMDGFSPSEGIVVIGATNRPDVLDPALLRPGRFDRSIGLERPDEAARLAILGVHAREKRLEPGVDLAALASRSVGLTGADLANVMNEGALLTARSGKASIGQAELDQALQRLLETPDRQRRLSLRDRSVAKRFTSAERVTFEGVAGADDAIEELAEVKDYLASPDRFQALGARAPRGILLSGPPGCGKTLLARAVAGEANAAFFSAAGSEFVEVYVGEGASRVRDLFAEARAVAPAIVFLDEIDSLGARRGSSPSSREADQTLNQVLVELDGFDDSGSVVVIAATNRPDILDPALLRPGRFDRRIEVGLPDRAGRRDILAIHARRKPLSADVNLDDLAGLTPGFSGADLANLMNEAALLAARRALADIPMPVVEEALDRVTIGITSRVATMSEQERRATAYHEAGHALVARALPVGGSAHKLTIVARGPALGYCRILHPDDRLSFSRSMLIDRMAVGLAGRLAEHMVLGEPQTGSSSDLAQVRRIALHMVCDEAMGDDLGLVPYPHDADGDPRSGRPRSEAATRLIESEVRRLVEEASERARRVLVRDRDALERVAAALLEHETLDAKDVENLAGSVRPVTLPDSARRGP